MLFLISAKYGVSVWFWFVVVVIVSSYLFFKGGKKDVFFIVCVFIEYSLALASKNKMKIKSLSSLA